MSPLSREGGAAVSGRQVRAWAPGRVNLIGDHTDYTGGYALPIAIELGTEVRYRHGGPNVKLTSSAQRGTAIVPIDQPLDTELLAAVTPTWARYVAGVVAAVQPAEGGTGRITSALPLGSGLSSSAALEVATALAIGFEGDPIALARACQTAEATAVGVPCGLMDQLVSASGVTGHALLVDFTSLAVSPVPIPSGVAIVVLHSGETRSLAGSPYSVRRAECEEASRAIGPLREVSLDDLAGITDPVVRRRARHVVTENERVLSFAEALRDRRLDVLHDVLAASHASLAADFEVSTPVLDELVGCLASMPGVIGARLTGAGFGGCAVALVREDELDLGTLPAPARRVSAGGPARLEVLED